MPTRGSAEVLAAAQLLRSVAGSPMDPVDPADPLPPPHERQSRVCYPRLAKQTAQASPASVSVGATPMRSAAALPSGTDEASRVQSRSDAADDANVRDAPPVPDADQHHDDDEVAEAASDPYSDWTKVECDDCKKWRWVEVGTFDMDAPWQCSMNPRQQFASCDVPEHADSDDEEEAPEEDSDSEAAEEDSDSSENGAKESVPIRAQGGKGRERASKLAAAQPVMSQLYHMSWPHRTPPPRKIPPEVSLRTVLIDTVALSQSVSPTDDLLSSLQDQLLPSGSEHRILQFGIAPTKKDLSAFTLSPQVEPRASLEPRARQPSGHF